MRTLAAVVVLVSACGFDGVDPQQTPGADAALPIDAMLPDADPEVRVTDVTSDMTAIRPGLYGLRVTIVIENISDSEATDVVATLSFSDGVNSRGPDFAWRDVDSREGVAASTPTTIAAGGSTSFSFVVDCLASAVPPGPISIDGRAQFTADGTRYSATADIAPLVVPFDTALNRAPIVVNETNDERNGNPRVCLREAIRAANQNPGDDRIVFDPAVFPPGGGVSSVIDVSLGQIQNIDATGGRIIIDGAGADFTLEFDTDSIGSGDYALVLQGGELVVRGITIKNSAYQYPFENLSVDNCGTNTSHDGGSVLVTGGTLIFESNVVTDPDVAARNCFGASIRVTGGTGHVFRANRFTEPVMDYLLLAGDAVEVADNLFLGGSDVSKGDDAVLVLAGATADLWITGNVFLDQPISALLLDGDSVGTVHVVNNTFGRNGSTILNRASIVRTNGQRPVAFTNNVHFDNVPEAFDDVSGNLGADVTFRFEVAFQNGLCGGCTVSPMTDILTEDPMLVDIGGTTRAAMTPQGGSPLIDSGTDIVDRNRRAAGRFNATGADRGAVEVDVVASPR